MKSRPETAGSNGHGIASGFTDAPFGGFAGYAWIGPVRSIGASFTVPRIAGGSPRGEASTWIGVQGQGPRTGFVQVGVNESRFWSVREQSNIDRYFAVWSDQRARFLPKTLFVVNAGDVVSARLASAATEWRLSITDETSGRHADLLVREPTQPTFDQAEWTQEDPGPPGSHVRYPEIEAPSFRELTIDGRPPSPGYLVLSSRWMSVNGTNLAPTALRGDGFTLEQAPPLSAAAAQYLRLTGAEHDALLNAEVERSAWGQTTRRDRVSRAARQLDQDGARARRALLAARWPKGVGSLVLAAVDAGAGFLKQAQPSVALSAPSFGAWNARVMRAWQQAYDTAAKLRLALGLPGAGAAADTLDR